MLLCMVTQLAKGIERICDELLAARVLCFRHGSERLHENVCSGSGLRQSVCRHLEEKTLELLLPVLQGILIGLDLDQPPSNLG